MEESSRKGEEVEEVAAERNATFDLYHYPCYLFQQALNHLFKCFGFEIGTNRKHNTSSLVNKPPSSESEEDRINPQSIAINDQKCSEEVTSSSAEAAVDQECNSATQGYDELTITSSVMLMRGRPGLSSGSGPQNN